MFDNLSDRLGGVFDKLKGRRAFRAKVGTGFALPRRDLKMNAAFDAGEARNV
ncbi:MAG: hypothetical protein AAGK02_16510 [Pseudomonadota bacterium]